MRQNTGSSLRQICHSSVWQPVDIMEGFECRFEIPCSDELDDVFEEPELSSVGFKTRRRQSISLYPD
jgi:hypothetical protein